MPGLNPEERRLLQSIVQQLSKGETVIEEPRETRDGEPLPHPTKQQDDELAQELRSMEICWRELVGFPPATQSRILDWLQHRSCMQHPEYYEALEN